MELKDFIYKNKERLNLPKDISYEFIVNLEDIINEWNMSNPSNIDKGMGNEIKELIRISSDMRILLEECRGEKLPIDLAKRIDRVLREISYLD